MFFIQLNTEIPGSISKKLMARRQAAIPQEPSHVTPIFAARAEGAVIEDVDGNNLKSIAEGQIGADLVAGVIIEPVIGEGGYWLCQLLS